MFELLNEQVQTRGWQWILALTFALAFSVFLRKTTAVIFTEFFRTKKWWPFAYIGAAVILSSLWYQVGLSVQFNAWYKDFYDLGGEAKNGKHTISEFWTSISIFCDIAFRYIVVAVATSYLTSRYALWWREAVYDNYFRRWPEVTVRLEGESQRIQEDVRDFADLLESLVLQFIRAIMTLIAFLPILWTMSEKIDLVELVATVPAGWYLPLKISFVVSGAALVAWSLSAMLPKILWGCLGARGLHEKLEANKTTFLTGAFLIFAAFLWQWSGNLDVAHLPRPLVILALLTAVGGTYVTRLVGTKLPGLQYNNQVQEAEFRRQLVLFEGNKLTALKTLAVGITQELFRLFTGVRSNYTRLFFHFAYFNTWINFYNQAMVVIPLMVMAPGLFDVKSAVTFGLMMQVYNTFGEVNGSVSVVMNNWKSITKIQSIWRRLRELDTHLDTQGATSIKSP